MSVGLFLICHPDSDWKIYAGCVFIMFVAVYFSFAKKFNSAELDIEIHSADEVDKFNSAIMWMMRNFLNLIADLVVGVIMVVLNISVGLLIVVELPFYLVYLCYKRCFSVDHSAVSPASDLDNLEAAAKTEEGDFIGSTDDISELTRLLEDSKICTITEKDLKAKMETIPERFCFLKCLKASDRDAFINKYITIINADATTQLKYYENGVIKVSTWLEIMRGIELQNNYCVYRDAYWGENTGSKNVSSVKVSYKSMLAEFGSEHICTVDLLIANRHISRIHWFRRSSFSNVNQWFWDKIIGFEI